MTTPDLDDLAARLPGMTGLDALRAMTTAADRAPHVGGLLGIRVESLDHGSATFSVTARDDFANPLGSVHGGICATLLDSVMGSAVHTTLEPGVLYTTLELSVRYVRAVPTDGGRLTATGTVVHRGRRTATAEGRVVDPSGRLVSHGTTTCLLLGQPR